MIWIKMMEDKFSMPAHYCLGLGLERRYLNGISTIRKIAILTCYVFNGGSPNNCEGCNIQTQLQRARGCRWVAVLVKHQSMLLARVAADRAHGFESQSLVSLSKTTRNSSECKFPCCSRLPRHLITDIMHCDASWIRWTVDRILGSFKTYYMYSHNRISSVIVQQLLVRWYL